MRILGIETSCDETAISLIVVDETSKSVRILGNTVHSQIDVHASYGGVFPILAKREHQINLVPVLAKTLTEAKMLKKDESASILNLNSIDDLLSREEELLKSFKEFIPTIQKPDIDYIAVTLGPGLEPALWVGLSFARALSSIWNIPIIPCNHMEGHVLTALIRQKMPSVYELLAPKFPALSLLISGGHTQIVLVDRIGKYEIVGETRDDAIGECFDKIARTLGLSYPGGPKISKLAEEARAKNIYSPMPLPRPMIDSDNLDFSFSGLKTSVLYLVQRLSKEGALSNEQIKGISRDAEDSVTEVIISKLRTAIERYAIETVIVGGGVIANKNIRENLEKLAKECSVSLLLPQFDHSTDNGLMIALAGYFNREKAVDSAVMLKAQGTLPIGPRS